MRKVKSCEVKLNVNADIVAVPQYSSLGRLGKSFVFFVLKMLIALFAILFWGSACSSPERGSRAAGLETSAKTISVKSGEDFQAALDAARPGDKILLEAGAIFRGSFKLPKKEGDEFIEILSAASTDKLPPPNLRIAPEKYKADMPKLESNRKGEPTILAVNGANHYRFVGIEFGPTVEGLNDIIQLGVGDETNVDDLPHHIEFDRVYIHGSPSDGQRRGIAANGRFIKITNSYISDIKRKDGESQAIAAWATDGPIEIRNNYLEAAGENLLFGGAGSRLRLVPSDCIVRDNHLNKPVVWRNEGWSVKNLFEIKNGRRIRVENNLMTNNWGMAQDGMAVLFTTRADNGDATVIQDVEFTGNFVKGSGGGINIFGGEGGGGRGLQIRNNVFADIEGKHWNSDGNFMKASEWDGISIENNTILQSGSIVVSYGRAIRKFVFRNNIIFENKYGFYGENTGSGQVAIDKFFPDATVTDNIIIGGAKSLYRERNLFPATLGEIGLSDPAAGDYRLRQNSPFRTKKLSDNQIGANINPNTIGSSDRPH